MSKKSSEKLSDAEALEKIARYEKNEIIFLKVCVYSFIIGIPALIIGMIVESGVVAGIGSVLFVGGFVCVYLKGKMRSNAESLVTNQLQDFYNTELQRAFGPCQHNKDMDINKTLIKNSVRWQSPGMSVMSGVFMRAVIRRLASLSKMWNCLR